MLESDEIIFRYMEQAIIFHDMGHFRDISILELAEKIYTQQKNNLYGNIQ